MEYVAARAVNGTSRKFTVPGQKRSLHKRFHKACTVKFREVPLRALVAASPSPHSPMTPAAGLSPGPSLARGCNNDGSDVFVSCYYSHQNNTLLYNWFIIERKWFLRHNTAQNSLAFKWQKLIRNLLTQFQHKRRVTFYKNNNVGRRT